jgi:hypothetical protein
MYEIVSDDIAFDLGGLPLEISVRISTRLWSRHRVGEAAASGSNAVPTSAGADSDRIPSSPACGEGASQITSTHGSIAKFFTMEGVS